MKLAFMSLKLVIFTVGAAWTAYGLLLLPRPSALLYFLCSAITMRGMWRT
jgi:hypothetical protein